MTTGLFTDLSHTYGPAYDSQGRRQGFDFEENRDSFIESRLRAKVEEDLTGIKQPSQEEMLESVADFHSHVKLCLDGNIREAKDADDHDGVMALQKLRLELFNELYNEEIHGEVSTVSDGLEASS